MDRFELFLSGIHSIYRNIQQIKSAEMEELGLKGTHFLCLYYLHKSEIPLTPVQLSKKCLLDKAAISRIIKQLIEKNLVFYEETTEKRRYRNALSLTSKGKQITEVFMDRINVALSKGGKGLTEEERSIFYSCLTKIKNNLQEIVDDGGVL
ncbi:MarR family winged helix-turn-helix transcriptional regulator [Amedibacterium intestinale]|mgnify:FL=1|uniref:HTH marR-type domain-containing protein n=1 Tax=Amedibacterium intestinale TaxID=2583452 RepID=A0A6N4TH65_9FIRM|nr:DUF4364 family protein [Amedibacterium intestinale]RHO22606.1 DUF4364 family protein [Eubacterium sp. AM18-26]RHO24404.1 DUF4364 family protein [Eubacterium sp. AM18-10LB-B]BBK22099.1 hypothetical protein Aargi30884_10020 [Amedibacterium intestinale]